MAGEAHLMEKVDEDALRALIEAMYLSAYADREFSDEERTLFARSLKFLTQQRVDETMLESILADLNERLEKQGRAACLQDIARRLSTDELRTAALVLASDIAAADGVIVPEERALLEELADALGLDRETVAAALEGLTK